MGDDITLSNNLGAKGDFAPRIETDGEDKPFIVDPLAPKPIEDERLKDIPSYIIRGAWFTMAHLILEKGAKVLDVKCGTGIKTFAMAALNPEISFIAIDSDIKKIETAKAKYILPNLEFIAGDIQENFVPLNSLDGIINSYSLHETYSENQASVKSIEESLQRQFNLLKKGGALFIQDHMLPTDHDYLLLEIPEEIRSDGVPDKPVDQLSDVELLLLFSEQARPREEDQYRGFYLEELPARFPRTRLFRLPAKWAREFILRKDNRKDWQSELYKEYSFFTLHDFTRTLKSYGARIFYTAPHWDQNIIRKRYNNKIRLFDDASNPLGAPETSTIILAQKQAPEKSLTLQERRPSRNAESQIRITAMRNEYDGKIYDLVSRDVRLNEILPYRITRDNKLHVFVHTDLPRSLINTVPRQNINLDGKTWSGHMIEALAVPEEVLLEQEKDRFRDVVDFTKKYFNLKPEMNCFFQDGPGFYPAPDCIDERVKTKYLSVTKPKHTSEPHYIIDEANGFSSKGIIREYDAQQLLNALSVGLLPNSRLEVQLLGLYELLGISYQSWASSPLTLDMVDAEKMTRVEEYVAKLAEDDLRFKPSNGNAGLIKTMQSVFVDEGLNAGSIKGLASRNMDFILNEEGSMNTAIVLPLAKSISGEVMAGVVETYLPVPQRYKGNGYIITCPSVPLPPDIKNLDMVQRYIADKFEVPIECVARMGEGFFSHIGVTPQRIYPYVVTPKGVSGWKKAGRGHGVTSVTPLYNLYRLMYLDNHDSFLKLVAQTYQSCLGQDSAMGVEFSFGNSHSKRKESFVGMGATEISYPVSTPDLDHDS